MPIRRLADPGVLEPEEVAFLQETFDEICARGRIDRKSEAAEELAVNLIAHYQRGLRGQELLAAVDPNKTTP